MPKTVTRYDVLISCPSDVGEYIENIKRSIHRFNSTYGDYRDVILRPKYWGDDSFAQSGGKAQELLNQQIVKRLILLLRFFGQNSESRQHTLVQERRKKLKL